MTQDTVTWRGRVRITCRHVDGTETVDEFDNAIMDAGKNLLRDALQGVNADIAYVALGSDSTAVAATQTTLVAEQFRKQITSQTDGATGVLTTVAYIAPPEANTFTIEEIGWFAGDDATSSTDTGVMVARVLYNKVKTNVESIQIDRTDTIA